MEILSGLSNFLKGQNQFAKAKLIIEDGSMTPDALDVQFNPSEYSISRGVQIDDKTAPGNQSSSKTAKPVSGEPTVMRVTLYFDAYTDLKSVGLSDVVDAAANFKKETALESITSAVKIVAPNAHQEVNDLCMTIARKVRYVASLHTPPRVHFLWGTLDFCGTIQSSNVTYTMFAPNGMPVRMKLALQIIGEEVELELQDERNQKESPDRTKERLLPYGDQLWMVAEDEYGDPSEWKTIAKANDILNPRKIDRAMRLKVPSIR